MRELSADTWPESLAHHFIAYRAHVRCKVAALRVTQGDADAGLEARRLHQMAIDHLEAAQVRLVMVGGSPGTGKTVLARGLGERLDATVLSTDEIRDELIPRTGDEPVACTPGRYAPEHVAAVYAELLRRAETALGRGESVVLDASWLDRAQRREARRVAERTSSMLTELRAVCSPDTALARIGRRRAEGADASEATAEIARQLDAEASPWGHATVVDTEAPLDEVVGLAECMVTVET